MDVETAKARMSEMLDEVRRAGYDAGYHDAVLAITGDLARELRRRITPETVGGVIDSLPRDKR